MTLSNERNKLKLRQVCFIFIALTPVTKISLLPSVAASFLEEQLWLGILINFVLDFIVLFAILLLLKKHDNAPIFDVVEQKLSPTCAKILFFLYSIFFFLKAIIPLLEQQDYVQNTLYEVTPTVLVFLPFFAVSFYTSLKELKILGRCVDISIWFTLLGLGLVLFLAVPICKIERLMPIIQKPTYKLIKGPFSTIIWFSDSVYMLIFAGHFLNQKQRALKISLSYLSGAVLIIVLAIIFYGAFGPIAKTRFWAIPELTIFSIAIANATRFDYIAIFLLLFSQVFAIILPIFSSVKCLQLALNLKRSIIPASIINGLLFLFVILFSNRLFKVFGVIVNVFGWIFICFGYVVPILLLLLPRGTKNAPLKA